MKQGQRLAGIYLEMLEALTVANEVIKAQNNGNCIVLVDKALKKANLFKFNAQKLLKAGFK